MSDKKGTNKNAGSGNQGTNQNNNTVTANPDDVNTAQDNIYSGIGFNQTKHPDEGIINSYAFDSSGNQTHMYGGILSNATNEYLDSIGEATQGSQNADGTYNYMLTPKGWAIKYGSYTAGQTQTGGAVGTGAGGVMGNTPLSEEMYISQQKTQGFLLGALSVFAPFPVSSVLGAGAADAYDSIGKYNEYRKGFTANKAMGSVNIENPKTANLGMGDVHPDQGNVSKKTKKTTHKITGNFFTGVDEATKKRTFFAS